MLGLVASYKDVIVAGLEQQENLLHRLLILGSVACLHKGLVEFTPKSNKNLGPV